MFESKNSNFRLAASIAEAQPLRYTLYRIIWTLISCASAPTPLHCHKNPQFKPARNLKSTVSDTPKLYRGLCYEISKKIVASATGDDIATYDEIIRLVASASSMTRQGVITYSDCDAQ